MVSITAARRLCVEGDQYLAPSVDPLGDDEAVLAFDQRRGENDVEVVLLETALGPRLDDVAESLRW